VTERSKFERSLQMVQSRSPGTPVGVVLNAIKTPADPYLYNYLHTDRRASRVLEGKV
jgi:hypothetical protein